MYTVSREEATPAISTPKQLVRRHFCTRYTCTYVHTYMYAYVYAYRPYMYVYVYAYRPCLKRRRRGPYRGQDSWSDAALAVALVVRPGGPITRCPSAAPAGGGHVSSRLALVLKMPRCIVCERGSVCVCVPSPTLSPTDPVPRAY